MRSIQSTLFTLFAASSAAYADTTLNLTQGVSPISHDVYELHMTVFWICVVIGIVVFGAMFYAMFYHRKSRGAKAAEFHSHPYLEIAWTVVPAVILILMAVPATKVLLNMNNTDQEDLTIKVTGYQWKWHYEYLEDGLSFFSNLATPYEQINNKVPKGEDYLREVDHPMVVPIHKKIRFLITSNDVNHAWWVPDLGVKRDALGGFINEAWTVIDKPGTYRGQCAELCGVNHAFMPIVVIALSEQGYKDWVAQQKGQATAGAAETNKEWTMKELMDNGEKVYSRICAACHQPGGVGLPPTFPALKGSKIATGPIEKHIETVMNGVSGTAMQAFKNQLSDSELASIITYERNAFGNNTGTSVQPIQIKAYRDGKPIAEALTVKPTGNAQVASGTAPASGTVAAAPVAKNGAPETATGVSEQPKPNAASATTVTPATPAAANVTTTVPTSTAVPSSSGAPGVTSPAESPSQTTPTAAQVSATEKQGNPSAPATTATSPATTAPATPTAASATNSAPAASNPDDLKSAIARGEKIYLNTCAACHQPTGVGMPPTFPALKNSPIATGPVAGHIDRVMNGKPGTAMMAFKDQYNDQDLADVITYERNAFGNNTGTLVTPEQIKAARQPGQNNK